MVKFQLVKYKYADETNVESLSEVIKDKKEMNAIAEEALADVLDDGQMMGLRKGYRIVQDGNVYRIVNYTNVKARQNTTGTRIYGFHEEF